MQQSYANLWFLVGFAIVFANALAAGSVPTDGNQSKLVAGEVKGVRVRLAASVPAVTRAASRVG